MGEKTQVFSDPERHGGRCRRGCCRVVVPVSADEGGTAPLDAAGIRRTERRACAAGRSAAGGRVCGRLPVPALCTDGRRLRDPPAERGTHRRDRRELVEDHPRQDPRRLSLHRRGAGARKRRSQHPDRCHGRQGHGTARGPEKAGGKIPDDLRRRRGPCVCVRRAACRDGIRAGGTAQHVLDRDPAVHLDGFDDRGLCGQCHLRSEAGLCTQD